MDLQNNHREDRSEPRFYPGFEQVRWQKAGCAELGAGELLDVSNMGLSFRIAPGQNPRLKLGEELSVRFLGADHRAAQYAVVWEHMTRGSLAVGCARITSDDLVATRKAPLPKLVVAISRQNVVDAEENLKPKVQSLMPGAEPV